MDTKLIVVALIVAAIVIAGIAVTMNKPAKTATSQIPNVPSENEISMPSENEITTNNTLPEPNTSEINLPSEI